MNYKKLTKSELIEQLTNANQATNLLKMIVGQYERLFQQQEKQILYLQAEPGTLTDPERMLLLSIRMQSGKTLADGLGYLIDNVFAVPEVLHPDDKERVLPLLELRDELREV